MEKAEGTLYDLIEHLDEAEIEMIIIQVIFAISSYQNNFQLQHNDLSIKNVFIEKVSSDTMYNGVLLDKTEQYTYQINTNTTITIPAIEWISKIADFGMSVKYSRPIIGYKGALQGNLEYNIPNWYDTAYDMIFFLGNVFMMMDVDFVNKSMAWIFGLDINATHDEIENNINYFEGRPPLERLGYFGHVTPEAFLMNTDIMGWYHKKPTKRRCNSGGEMICSIKK